MRPVDDPNTDAQEPYGLWAAALIIGLLLFRIVILWFNPLGLHGDEAQYWAWSREVDFGYFSKPPLIAWIIAVSTGLFGNAEWAVRLPSPILHSVSATLIYLSAKHLYSSKAGLVAAALYALMPGVVLSSLLITTDAILLTFVSLAVYAWIRLRDEPSARWAALLGIAIGAGLLAKYAMIYIGPGLILASLLEPKTRRGLSGSRGLLAVALAVLIIMPNLIWNARNGFMTFAHTSENADLGDGAAFNLVGLIEFIGAQFLVFGPITFALLILALWHRNADWRNFKTMGIETTLALLIITPLLIVSVQALISRANANWAGFAYAVAPILIAGWATTPVKARWIKIGVMINLALAFAGSIIVIQPPWTDQIGATNTVKRLRAWPQTVAAITARYADTDAIIAVDNRLVFYDLRYYGIEETASLYHWRYDTSIGHQAELTDGLVPGEDRPILLLSVHHDYEPFFQDDFLDLTRGDDLVINLGDGIERRFRVYSARGYRGPKDRARDAN